MSGRVTRGKVLEIPTILAGEYVGNKYVEKAFPAAKIDTNRSNEVIIKIYNPETGHYVDPAGTVGRKVLAKATQETLDKYTVAVNLLGGDLKPPRARGTGSSRSSRSKLGVEIVNPRSGKKYDLSKALAFFDGSPELFYRELRKTHPEAAAVLKELVDGGEAYYGMQGYFAYTNSRGIATHRWVPLWSDNFIKIAVQNPSAARSLLQGKLYDSAQASAAKVEHKSERTSSRRATEKVDQIFNMGLKYKDPYKKSTLTLGSDLSVKRARETPGYIDALTPSLREMNKNKREVDDALAMFKDAVRTSRSRSRSPAGSRSSSRGGSPSGSRGSSPVVRARTAPAQYGGDDEEEPARTVVPPRGAGSGSPAAGRTRRRVIQE